MLYIYIHDLYSNTNLNDNITLLIYILHGDIIVSDSLWTSSAPQAWNNLG